MDKFKDEEKFYRSLNFDLSEDLLRQYYPKKNIKQAWEDVKKYLNNHQFTHRQYSGYWSDKPLSDIELFKFSNTMFNEIDWLIKCASKFDATVIIERTDLIGAYLEDNKVKDLLNKNKIQDKANPPEKNQEDFSFKQGSEKSKNTNMITQPVKTEVTLEQATKMAQAGIPFQITHGDNQKVMAVFDKSDIDKVKQIKNRPRNKQEADN